VHCFPCQFIAFQAMKSVQLMKQEALVFKR